MQMLRTNTAIRIHPPSELTKDRWHVENFDSRKTYAIPEVAITLLIYCITPKSQENIVTEFGSFYKINNQIIDKIIASFIEKQLIILQRDASAQANEIKLNSELFFEQYAQWNAYNWGSAAEYHFFTYDYPFLDYSASGNGWLIAEQGMKRYSEQEPDINRVKIYDDHYEKINLSLPFDILLEDASNIFSETTTTNLDIHKLSTIAAFGFAKTAEASIRWEGSPLIRRISPSGGSRHPTEGYFIALKVEGLEQGIYHIQSAPYCFVKLKTTEKIDICRIFPELDFDSLQKPAAIFILTSIFERNMFRYREPRTFRTIHMDAGHILGTIELISNYLGITSKISHQFDEKIIEQLIGIDGLSEGVMSSVSIFNSICESVHVRK